MAEGRFTPEEKLLEIIEGHGSNADTHKTGHHAASGNFAQMLRLRMGGFFTLHVAARAAMVLAVLVSVFFIFDFVRKKMALVKKFNIVVQAPPPPARESALGINVDLPDILNRLRQKNIFTLDTFSQAPREEVLPPEKEIASLKLVGVLWSQSPEVIIEDTSSGKTYMLKRGDDILRWKVKDIFPDKAVIASDNGEWELQ